MSENQTLSLQVSFERLKRNGLQPKTMFDIGVATGTPGFYQVFDDVRYVLVDPLTESEPFMQKICAQFPGAVYELAGAGAAPGEAEFAVDPGFSGSSFYGGKKLERRTVPIVTLDGLVEKHKLEPPFIVKLDVQGYELEVLRGFTANLKHTEAIVAETNFWADRKGRGMPQHHELIAFMAANGFMVYDIAKLARRQRDGALAEADYVFVRADSLLREHASSRTPEQIAERQAQKLAKFAAEKARL